ncbi:hypothetical protein KC19_11G003200 [Ceratodon purpureus]|uniref:Alpha-(1,6)-fucosyltransferase N- and catalytic domain-containing protein n=1 Tax=Ceratodon purpureus TaxID=3225 RepID=A0A8T0GF30_CERPU|nr:hypothetical protein KC19_11G003200 [Ceratodon purpureus]
MMLRIPVLFSATIVVSFIVLIALPVWRLYGDFVVTDKQRRRQECACEGDLRYHGFNTSTAAAAAAAAPDENPPGSDVVREENCDTRLFPQGHWNRVARGTHIIRWNSTGHHMRYGTIAVQHAIWRHQHPKSCKRKKFLVYKASGNGNGIGSMLHKATILLQAALDLDRILVFYPQRHGQWLDGPFCVGARTLDSCYFEPISSCSIRTAMGRRTWENTAWLDAITYGRNSERTLKDDCFTFGAIFLFRSTPFMFHELLAQGNISIASYYWWRAQGVAYLVRPNARTMRELEYRRWEVFQNETIEEGTLSVHVRRGDKGKESTLAPDEVYLATADAVVRDNPDSVKRSIFLSTEDASTVQFFSALSNWTVRWTNVRRQSRDYNGGTTGFAQLVGWNEEFLNSLLSLQLALECNAWVGMISSNWNRLIDELRSTIRCKSDRPYVDVFVGSNIKDYDWR